MSDNIDKLLESIKGDKGIKNQVKVLKKKAKGLGDQLEEVQLEQLSDIEKKKEEKKLEQDKKKLRGQVKELQKQAKNENDSNKVPKGEGAKGTGGGNSNGVRCYIRYNNQGNPYRICSDGAVPKPKKPKSIITPIMDAGKFAENNGGYANLSKEQERTYHRLYMAKQRQNEKGIEDGGKAFKEIIQAENQMKKEEARLKKLVKKEKAFAKKENRRKYKEELSKQGKANRTNKAFIKKLKEKYGISDSFQADLKENKSDIEEVESNIKTLENKVKKGKKQIKQTLEVKTKSNISLDFD